MTAFDAKEAAELAQMLEGHALYDYGVRWCDDAASQLRAAIARVEQIEALALEACDIAVKRREIRTQIDDHYWQVVDVFPSDADKSRISAIREAVGGKP